MLFLIVKRHTNYCRFSKNDDDYLIETAIWSLGKLKCNDIDIINKICSILYKQFNNKRVVIQTLTKLGVKKEIDKIRSLSKISNHPMELKEHLLPH